MAKARDTIKETLDYNRKGYRNGRKEPEVVRLVRKRLVRKRLVRKRLVRKRLVRKRLVRKKLVKKTKMN
jgi:hypothetical protein